jgi:carbonic anhydrase/acetyltransferase-like protein (isoleucine patch superfamily)
MHLEDESLVGMGATVLDGAVIGRGSVVGAQSLVTQNTTIPPGSLVYGSPAREIRRLTKEESSHYRSYHEGYLRLAAAQRGDTL